MRYFFLSLLMFLVACKPPGKSNNTYTYSVGNDLMGNSLKKGGTYSLIQSNSYHSDQIIVYKLIDAESKKSSQIPCRIVGVPGDTVLIRNGRIYVNNKLFLLPPTAKYHYYLYLKYNADEEGMQRDFEVSRDKYSKKVDAFLTKADSLRLFKLFGFQIDSCKEAPFDFNYAVLLNGENDLGWDTHNFGPVAIPVQGSTVSASYFKKFTCSNNQAPVLSGAVKIDQPYYFVIMDNFDNAGYDSRDIGLIPRSQIMGFLNPYQQ